MSDDLPYRRGEMRKTFWPSPRSRDQAVELGLAVDERLAGHDLAVDEGVVHVVTLSGVMITPVNVMPIALRWRSDYATWRKRSSGSWPV